MKILLVGPGLMPIPTDGWGAVETVVWQQKVHLERIGHTVDILNTRGIISALRSRPWDYDLVHLHYDELGDLWVRLSRVFKFPLVVTTHYGYAAWPERWERSYCDSFRSCAKARGHLALSQEIADVIRSKGYKGWIGVLPNGTEVHEIEFSTGEGNGRAICLGKVEVRKNQAKLAAIFTEQGVGCDFVGPKIDPSFAVDGSATRYFGPWSREDVHKKLTGYSALILASNGEAHALVTLEAMAAGLSLVISREATANLDLSLPWVYVVDRIDDEIASVVQRACAENARYRRDIRTYVETTFDWRVIAEEYIHQAQIALESMRS